MMGPHGRFCLPLRIIICTPSGALVHVGLTLPSSYARDSRSGALQAGLVHMPMPVAWTRLKRQTVLIDLPLIMMASEPCQLGPRTLQDVGHVSYNKLAPEELPDFVPRACGAELLCAVLACEQAYCRSEPRHHDDHKQGWCHVTDATNLYGDTASCH